MNIEETFRRDYSSALFLYIFCTKRYSIIKSKIENSGSALVGENSPVDLRQLESANLHHERCSDFFTPFVPQPRCRGAFGSYVLLSSFVTLVVVVPDGFGTFFCPAGKLLPLLSQEALYSLLY